MGNTFVLKDCAGRPGGYAMLQAGQLRCRINVPAPQMTLLAGFGGGKQETYALGGGSEQAFACTECVLLGACVLSEGRLMLACGQAPAVLKPRSQPPKAPESAKIEPRLCERQEQEAAQQVGNAFAQRRWPPPPCMPGAVYTLGRWQDQSG